MDLDDDLIVVDDVDVDPSPSYVPKSHSAAASTPSVPASTRPQRAAARRRPSTPALSDFGEPSTVRQTRSSNAKPRAAPKLKLKLSEKAASQAPGVSFLGPYDRELDSDDEDLSFEEQFILRMPPGEDCERLRKMIASREVGPDVWFKFKDSRRAIFHIGNNSYSAKLVDLPCIVESQKTMDNKQMFKVADICQMLLVEKRVPNEEAVGSHKSFNIDDFIWQHGITPPLHWVRKRRFRKRVNKRTIESVEEEVERLLEQDALADEVKYEVLDNVNPDLSDSEFIERDEPAQTPGETGDMATPAGGGADDDGGSDDGDEPDVEGDIDEDLAAELDQALGDSDDEEDEDEDEDESEEDDEDDEDDDDDAVQARQLLNEEIGDLEEAVARKENERQMAAVPPGTEADDEEGDLFGPDDGAVGMDIS
ncbi:hypothetical protein FA95DRAFT_1585479 [Auriscalpium vulgare]|uniref:Uncharacterized protein n=1 Tax=Auriscalpium vulgare TaxID=40419 RepID=A0ACB8R3I6_9AGAM|nr:hypothetical protein FA95DRAFT_1585479 [Auriscalpium vulgare]